MLFSSSQYFIYLLQVNLPEGYFHFTVQLKINCCTVLVKCCFIMEEPSGVVSSGEEKYVLVLQKQQKWHIWNLKITRRQAYWYKVSVWSQKKKKLLCSIIDGFMILAEENRTSSYAQEQFGCRREQAANPWHQNCIAHNYSSSTSTAKFSARAGI